jgi:hypothetical protein
MNEQQSDSVFATTVAGLLASAQVLAVVLKIIGAWQVSWWCALFFLWGLPLWGITFGLGLCVVSYMQGALQSGGKKNAAQ